MRRADFLLTADDLMPIIQVLREGLIRRPTPEGIPHFNLQAAAESSEEFFRSVRELGKVGSGLSAHDLASAAKGMVTGYHGLWERPFPSRTGEGADPLLGHPGAAPA